MARWRAATRGRVDFAPAQQEAARFPQITKESWKRSVQLVTPRARSTAGPRLCFARWRTRRSAAGCWASTAACRGRNSLAKRRTGWSSGIADFFSGLTRLAWGRDPQPSSYILSRWVFLRLLGLVYVIAFLSLWGQLAGLVGRARNSSGRLIFCRPCSSTYGSDAYHLFPTLAWINSISSINSSDAGLKFLCGAGALAGLLVVLGVVTGPALALAWVFYLSLVTVGQEFLSFQWDILLLEIGFLAIFLAPWRLLEPPWRSGNSRCFDHGSVAGALASIPAHVSCRAP